MKKIYGFAFAASLLALASCSNDVEPVQNPTPGDVEEGGYMAFNIVNPNGTRAEGDFEYGKEEENAAATGTFLFFNEEGEMTQVPQTIMLETASTNTSGDPIAVIKKAVVVVGGSGKYNTTDHKPSQVLVILNDNTGVDWNRMDLDEVLQKATEVAVATDNNFLMTNATYYGDKEDGKATVIKATQLGDKVYETRQEALAADAAVDIYVERLAAKVSVITNGEDFKISETGDFQVAGADGGKMNLKPVITGIQIADQAITEYIFKDINADWIDQWAAVDGSTAFRANWAVTPDTKFANLTYNDYITELNGNGLSKDGYDFYIKENTSYDKTQEDLTKNRASSLLLTAQLTTDGTLDNAIDALVRWAGMYYTPEMFLVQAANFTNKYYVKSEEEGKIKLTSLTSANLAYYTETEHATLVAAGKLKQYEMAVKVKEEKGKTLEIVTLKDGKTINDELEADDLTSKSAEDVNADLLDEACRCWYWNGGRSYYYVNIEHDGTIGEGYDFKNGVVRNNVYKITLNSLSGLGTPVYNPEEVIIPQKPQEDLWYIAAKINILQWRIVSQNADFNNVPV